MFKLISFVEDCEYESRECNLKTFCHAELVSASCQVVVWLGFWIDPEINSG